MGNFAKIENGKVIDIIVATQDVIDSLFEGEYIEYTNEAGIGYDYVDGYFVPPKPYPSWLLIDYQWAAPIEKPIDDKNYLWDETTVSWKEITNAV